MTTELSESKRAMRHGITRLSNWLRLAIILGASLGMAMFNADCARADSEDKDLVEINKLLLSDEEFQFRQMDMKWMNAPAAKHKATWWELHSLFNLHYGHSPDLTKVETALSFAPNDPHVLGTYAISLLVDRKRDKCLKIANLAAQLDPKDQRLRSIQTICNACYGNTKVSKADVMAMVEKGGSQMETYMGADHFFVVRFDHAGQRAVYDAMVKNNPKSAWVYCRRGIELRRKGVY